MSQRPMPGPGRGETRGRGGGGNWSFDWSNLQLPPELDRLLGGMTDTMVGTDWESGTDAWGNPNIRHEGGMLDFMRELASQKPRQDRRAFDLYEQSKRMDLRRAHEAMQARDAQMQEEQRRYERELKEREKAELLERAETERARQMMFHDVPAPGNRFMPAATMPGYQRFPTDGLAQTQMWTQMFGPSGR